MDLVLFLFGLGLIIVVGHGLWVVLALAVRALRGTTPADVVRRQVWRLAERKCLRCGAPLPRLNEECPECGLELRGPLARGLRDVVCAWEQIGRLVATGECDRATADYLKQCLRERRKALLEKEEPTPQAEPVPVLEPAQEAADVPEVIPAAPEPPPSATEIAPGPAPVQAPVLEVTAPPPRPRRSLTTVLAAFMEERNILWGELVGGLLIVGCSIALVITLWQSLEEIPYFPFLVFAGITVGLFAAGEYTLHHWKLESTSRGLLVIAVLLVPLNLLVLADPARGLPGTWTEAAVKAAALLVFALVVHTGGRDLFAVDILPGAVDRRWLLVLAVIGAAGSQLVVPRLLEGEQPLLFALLGCVPAACQALAVGGALRGVGSPSTPGPSGTEPVPGRVPEGPTSPVRQREAHALLIFLGLASFAVAVALGFLVSRGADVTGTLPHLAIPLAMAGVPVVLTGLRVGRGLTDPGAEGVRTAATAIGLAGVVVMLAGVALAWPRPLPLIFTTLFAGVVLAGLAFRYRAPAGHSVALPCLALGYLTAIQLFAGHLGDSDRGLAAALLDSPSGSALVAFAFLLALAAEWLVRGGGRGHVLAYLVGGAIALVGGAILLAEHGGNPPLLVEATLALVAAVLAGRRDEPGAVQADSLARPLLWSAQLAGILAVPLLFVPDNSALAAAVQTLWLAGVWLAVAWRLRSAAWFTAFQAALSGSVLFAVTAWLQGQDWVRDERFGLLDPRSLQAYGVGLGVLALGWVLARLASRRTALLTEWWQTRWPALDLIVLSTLVAGQLILAVWGVVPGTVAELAPTGHSFPTSPLYAEAYGLGAWILLGTLAVALLAGLWERLTGGWAVYGLQVLALTVPVLAGGCYGDELATASALRWGLAVAFVLYSTLSWGRASLAKWANQARMAVEPDPRRAGIIRQMLMGVAGLVLLLTAVVAALGFAGVTPSGPAEGSVFARLGWTLSNVIPLVLLSVGLSGHAVREGSPGYAFAAGQVAAVSLMGGYALAVVTGGGTLGVEEAVRVLQLGSLAEALWALGWLLSRRWVAAWREAGTPTARPLMLLQSGLACAGLFLLLAGSVLNPLNLTEGLQPWAVETGSPLGWLVLGSALAAPAVRARQLQNPPPWWGICAGSLAALSLMACSVERLWPGAGYPVLVLAWAAHPLLWSLAALAERSRPGLVLWVSWAGLDALAFVVALPAALALVMALGAASQQEYLVAAGAAGLLGAAGATLAVGYRRDELAFIAGLLLNLAVSFGVVHFHNDQPLSSWLAALVQANLVTCAVVALLWQWPRFRLPAGPLLAVQVLLGLTGNGLLLLSGFMPLFLDPSMAGAVVPVEIGLGGGWLATLLVTFAAFWYLDKVRPRWRLHALGYFGAAAGVLAACFAAQWDTGNWLAYYVLLAAWCSAGLGVVAAGSITFSLREAGLATDAAEPQTGRLAALFPEELVRRWLDGMGAAVVLLALRAMTDGPYQPYPSAAATFIVSLMAGAMAIWFRTSFHVYASGLLLNLVGLLLWSEWGPDTLPGFLLCNALGLAVASAFWSGLELSGLWGRGPAGDSSAIATHRRVIPFPHFAAVLALILLGYVVFRALWSDLAGWSVDVADPFAWTAVGLAGVAVGVCLWDRAARFPVAGLYALGLTAAGLLLHGIARSPADLGWYAALLLAVHAVLAAVFRRMAGEPFILGRRLGWPPRAVGWLLPAQTAVASLAAGLSVWVCLDFVTLAERLAGPLAVLVLVPVAVQLANCGAEPWRGVARSAALLLAGLALGEGGWAWPDPAGAAVWLERNVLLLLALALMAVLCSAALERVLARFPEWAEPGRRLAPLFAGLAALTLAVLLGQQLKAYDPVTRHTPLGPESVVVVVVALLLLLICTLRWALAPGRDPLGLSESRRSLYVYGAEALVVLLFVHLRLNVPQLFSGLLAAYWQLIVLLVAYLLVGIGEFFGRRGLAVLAGPLFRTGVLLPLLPLLAFWARPPAALFGFADAYAPGLRPLLRYLEQLAQQFDRYALLWLLVGVLYTLVALARRSWGFALLAAFAVNAALWSLLAHNDIALVVHPQAWLIPPALVVLVAEHLHRERLRPAVSLGLRYFGLSLVYVSSTADLFIAGVGNSVVLPVVLALLAVLGVLAGILLRVRAFLFLGVSFLILDVFTMIWHAAVDRYHTWVWWVSGIVLGAAVLALFAVFEKRRQDVLHLIEELKRWD
jgi:hypothetical protein